jgi:hypothetical protein
MLRKFFFVFIILPIEFYSQEPGIAREELRWAFFHPFAAVKIKFITKKCARSVDLQEIRSQLDSFSNGGKLDAFRHIYYMAAYAQKIRPRKIEKLGVAHEKSNYRQFKKGKLEDGELPDSLSSVMDLQNNKTGIKIGRENKNLVLRDLIPFVVTRIKNGDALILKRNSMGKFVSCDGKIVELPKTGKKWVLPKCLIASNESYKD